MRRDWDLIRLLLLELEDETVDLSAYSTEQIHYNRYLIVDSKLAVGRVNRQRVGKGEWAIVSSHLSFLTSIGHDFLDNARSESVWQEVKKQISEKGAGVSLGVIQALLVQFVKQQFGL